MHSLDSFQKFLTFSPDHPLKKSQQEQCLLSLTVGLVQRSTWYSKDDITKVRSIRKSSEEENPNKGGTRPRAIFSWPHQEHAVDFSSRVYINCWLFYESWFQGVLPRLFTSRTWIKTELIMYLHQELTFPGIKYMSRLSSVWVSV